MEELVFTKDFFARLEKLSIHITTLMNKGGVGNRKSKAKGMSVEFSDYREYAPSDDYRRIDWNAYGRFKKLYVKLFMEEKEATIRVFIDNSKSMSYHNKNIMALRLAATFSYLGLNNLDRVLIHEFVSKHDSIYLGQGKNSFQRYIKYLQELQFDNNVTSFDSIKRLNLNSGGLCIIISDFFTTDSVEDIIRYLKYNKQQVLLLNVLSKEELEPTLEGRLKLLDSETGDSKDMEINIPMINRYKEAVEQFTSNLSDICSKYGASYVKVCSDDKVEKIILEELLGSYVRMC